MRIAVDIMGGDKAPHEIVLGCVEAAQHIEELPGVEQIIMVGRKDACDSELKKLGVTLGPRLGFVEAASTVDMADKPVDAVRHKKDNSITKCMDLVKSGEAQAMLSAGNSGAVAAAALMTLGRIKGVYRPIIACVLPTQPMRPMLLVDGGANMDCEPNWLVQFAIMGSVYSEKVLGAKNPKVGLLSIGTECGKGNEVTKAAFDLLQKSDVNFCGNVEGHDLLKGQIDVVVCDGFVGNAVLKTTESVARTIGAWLKSELIRNPFRKILAFLLRSAFKSLKKRMDPEVYGGAVLLGVPGACIITHGASTHKAIYHTIHVAANATRNELSPTIAKRIAEHRAKLAAEAEAAKAAAAAEAEAPKKP